MDCQDRYAYWLQHVDDAMACELKNIESDENEVFDCFYKEIEFGTGGMRGVIGAGCNRINCMLKKHSK